MTPDQDQKKKREMYRMEGKKVVSNHAMGHGKAGAS